MSVRSGWSRVGGVRTDAFAVDETETVLRLAGQAATALAEADALEQQGWLSQVNAAVLDGVREGLALVGLDDELVFANAAMEQLATRLSMPIGAAIGADRGDLPAEFDGESYFADWEAVLADSDEPTADELAVSGFVLERYTAPIDDARGARIGRLVVLRDVTREREVDQLKSTLMQTVSHELRTPLASVAGLRGAAAHAPARRGLAVGDPRHRPPRGQAAVVADRRLPRPADDRGAAAGARAGAVRHGGVAGGVRGGVRRAERGAPARADALRVAGDGARRPGARGAGDREPALERDQVLAGRRRGAGGCGLRRKAWCGWPWPTRAWASRRPRSRGSSRSSSGSRARRPCAWAGPGSGWRWRTTSWSRTAATMGFESVEGDGSTFWFTLPTA